MIIQCEKCATRFKVADDKVTPQGIKVRCSKCQHVFTARASDGKARPGPTPSGIFAAPEARSPSPSSGPPSSGSTSPGQPSSGQVSSSQPKSGPVSSGSVKVPQASLALSRPGFDPFAPPPSTPSAPSSSAGGAAGFSLGFDDGPTPGEDRSFFGAPNQTIGGADDDDVPAPPPPSPTSGLGGFERGPPTPTSSADPFGASLHGGPSADPFGASPLAPGDPTAAFVDPFAAPSGPSAPAAFPVGGDPFGAPAAADPFASAALAGPGTFGPPGADPFVDEASAEPPAPPASSGAGPSGGDDPFAGLGVEVDDPYAPEEPPPAPPPTPADAAPPPPTPAPVVAKVEAPAPAASPPPRSRRRIPPAVPRLAWAAVQACILVGFLTLSLVWVRGGSVDDIAAGNALEVMLGRASSHGEGQAGLHVEDVVVARRPVEVAPDLVVVSGYVVGGDVSQPAARVTVRFGDGAPGGAAWANAKVDGVDLVTAASADELLALNERVPDEPAIAPGARAPFVVLVRGAPDGAKADVSVARAEPPRTAAADVTRPPPDEKPAERNKVRRRAPKGEGRSGARLEADADDAKPRPKAKRTSREQG